MSPSYRVLPCLLLLLFAAACGSTTESLLLQRTALHAAVDDDGAGRWAVVWTSQGDDDARVVLALYDAGETAPASRVAVDIPREREVSDVEPSVLWCGDSIVMVAWQRIRNGEMDLLYRCFDRDGVPRGEVVRVREAALDGNARYPKLVRAGDRRVLALWLEGGDVYARPFDTGGDPSGPTFAVTSDGTATLQGRPYAGSGTTGAVVVYADNRIDRRWKFYARRCAEDCGDNDFLVDSAQNKAMTTQCTVWLPGAQRAVFTFKDYREGNSNIYRRIADLHSGRLTAAERVNDDTGNRWQRLPAIDGDARGNSVICWEDYRNTEGNQQGDTYLQCYDAAFVRVGVNERVNDGTARVPRKWPQLAMASGGTYLVLWHQGEDGNFALHGQWLRFPAVRLGSNFSLSGSAAE